MSHISFLRGFCLILLIQGLTVGCKQGTNSSSAGSTENQVLAGRGEPQETPRSDKGNSGSGSEIHSRQIIGENDIVDVRDAGSKYLDIARSVAIQVPRERVKQFRTSSGHESFRILDRAKSIPNLCSDEPLYGEQQTGSCSATLIAPDLLLTAGHCVELDCKDKFWIFDYQKQSNGSVRQIYSKEQVRTCKRILDGSRLTYGKGIDSNPSSLDFALILLNRPVLDRRPINVNTDPSRVTIERELYTIGSPYGTPLKFADNGRVKSRNVGSFRFSDDLDVFPGNSGSGVFSKDSDELLGILVEGKRPYMRDPEAKCDRLIRSEQCKIGETGDCRLNINGSIDTSQIPGLRDAIEESDKRMKKLSKPILHNAPFLNEIEKKVEFIAFRDFLQARVEVRNTDGTPVLSLIKRKNQIQCNHLTCSIDLENSFEVTTSAYEVRVTLSGYSAVGYYNQSSDWELMWIQEISNRIQMYFVGCKKRAMITFPEPVDKVNFSIRVFSRAYIHTYAQFSWEELPNRRCFKGRCSTWVEIGEAYESENLPDERYFDEPGLEVIAKPYPDVVAPLARYFGISRYSIDFPENFKTCGN